MKLNKIKTNKKAVVVIKEPKIVPHYENYNETVDLEESMEYEDYNINYIAPEGEFNSSFSVEDLPYCCGVAEVGGLTCTAKHPKLHEVLDTLVSVNKGRTLILNTNGKDSCPDYDRALTKCKYWTLVKVFKSDGTGNTIKVWMSNND